jgi:exo-beta-1,3-glucanase (GH17 family)
VFFDITSVLLFLFWATPNGEQPSNKTIKNIKMLLKGLIFLAGILNSVLTTPASGLHLDNSLPPLDLTEYVTNVTDNGNGQYFENSAVSKIIQGVCYSPMHNPEYPLFGGSPWGLDRAMLDDFAMMKNYYSVVRTYYSSFYGVPVTPAAAANGVKLYLGVFMTNEAWYQNQVNDAIAAVRNYPNTIAAIIVGNENIWPAGPYSPQEVSRRITELRNRLQSEVGRTVPIGTVQRAAEWLNWNIRGEMIELAKNCDIVGVNIYPFFDNGYDARNPLVILDAVWDQMMNIYPPEKVRLTEIGYPTGGAPSTISPRVIPSLENSLHFYKAYLKWNPSRGGNEAFWFMFFDRQPGDNSMEVELEKYFGFFTWQKKAKAGDYPQRLSSFINTPPPTTLAPRTKPPVTPPPTTLAPTTKPPVTPPPTTTRPPVMKSPPSTTKRPVPSNLFFSKPNQVCRIKKRFV